MPNTLRFYLIDTNARDWKKAPDAKPWDESTNQALLAYMEAHRSEANEDTALTKIAKQLKVDRSTCKALWYRHNALQTMRQRIEDHAAAKQKSQASTR